MLMKNHKALQPDDDEDVKGAALPLTVKVLRQETPSKNAKQTSPQRKLHHSNNYTFCCFLRSMWRTRHASPSASCCYRNKVFGVYFKEERENKKERAH